MSGIERWEILPHIHVACGGGRLLSREEADGTVIVRCANCGEEHESGAGGADARSAHIAMCFCGIAVAKVRMRCVENTAVSDAPDEIVAEEVPAS
jgi:hypothetical protein